MNLRNFYVVAAAGIGIQLALAAWGFAQVGFGATVPNHWGPDGQVDGYGPAWLSFLMAPVVSIGITVLFGFIPGSSRGARTCAARLRPTGSSGSR